MFFEGKSMGKLNNHMVDMMAVGLVNEINKTTSEHQKHAVIASFIDTFGKEVVKNGYEVLPNWDQPTTAKTPTQNKGMAINDYMVDLMAVGLAGDINNAESDHQKAVIVSGFVNNFAGEVVIHGYESTHDFGWKD